MNKSLSLDELKRIFPENFFLKEEKTKGGTGKKIYLEVERESEEEVDRAVARELDRIFFYTSIYIEHKKIETKKDGKKIQTFEMLFSVLGPISELERENWGSNDVLERQLALWKMAQRTPFTGLKPVVLYLIVEAEFNVSPEVETVLRNIMVILWIHSMNFVC